MPASRLSNLCSLACVELVNKGLLIILAYRDNEIDEDHPLHGILNRMHASDSTVHATEIRLKNIDAVNLNKLVTTVTRVDSSETKPLADIVYQKTRGNPFYSIQFLRIDSSGNSEESLREALALALNEGLIEETVEPGSYRFAHDRIQQVAYALISNGAEREALHLRIERLLKKQKECNGEE